MKFKPERILTVLRHFAYSYVEFASVVRAGLGRVLPGEELRRVWVRECVRLGLRIEGGRR